MIKSRRCAIWQSARVRKKQAKRKKEVNNTKKYGYMNKKLKVVIPCVFDYAENFVENYAIVKYQGKDGLIDTKGNFYASEDLMVGVKRSIKVK